MNKSVPSENEENDQYADESRMRSPSPVILSSDPDYPPHSINRTPNETPQESTFRKSNNIHTSRKYSATRFIIGLNIIVFALMALSGVDIMAPSIENLVNWGANIRMLTQFQTWRLITSAFIHIGIFHILMNMYALAFIGNLIEPLLGRYRFSVAYLGTAIMASSVSTYWHENVVSAGASGAIFGMLGLCLALLSTNLINPMIRTSLRKSIGKLVLYNLIIGLMPGIDNAAHVGGLISGFIFGLLYVPSIRRPSNAYLRHTIVIVIIILVVMAIPFFLYST